MRYREKQLRGRKGLTLLEMVIAMAIITVVFSSILPLFRNVQASWDARRGAAEANQSGRVVMEFLNRRITTSAKITAVSNSSDTDGFIEFVDNTGATLRCDLAANNYIQFGPVGSQSELAGPVTSLKFTCYTLDDMDTASTDVGSIRFVKIDADFVNSASRGADKAFTTSAYLQTNGNNTETEIHTPFEFDGVKGKDPALAKIDTTHYLCVYAGDGDDGWATVLMVDTDTWEITKGTSFEYDTDDGKTPALSQINSSNYLCAYEGGAGKDKEGWVTVLAVDTDSWTITNETPLKYDDINGKTPALSQINSSHYLCAYVSDKDDGWATVLTVDTGTWEITNETPFEFDASKGKTLVLSQIDSTHYLCSYEGDKSDGWATVLVVDTDTWEITKGTSLEYDPDKGKTPDLAQIDSTHYLCTYTGPNDDGWATVLSVDTDTWDITNATPFEFNNAKGKAPALAQIDSTRYLCTYEGGEGKDSEGWSNILTVDTDTWTVSSDSSFIFDVAKGKVPALVHISGNNYLCAYQGDGDDGWAVVITTGTDSGLAP